MSIKKIVIIALGLISPLIANPNCMICLPDICLHADAGVDILYWRPCNDQFEYAQFRRSQHNRIKPLIMVPSYEWGFRLFATLRDKCNRNFASLRWTYLNGTSSNTTNKGESLLYVLPQFALVDTVVATQKTRYSKVSLRAGRRFCGNERAYLYSYAGGRYAEAIVNQHIHVEGSQNTYYFYDFLTTFSGGGVEIGVGAAWDVWCGFGLEAHLGGLALVGARKYILAYTPNAIGVNEAFSNRKQCLGGYEVRIAVNYIYECECWWLKGQVGYEHHHYGNMLWRLPNLFFGDYPLAASFGVGGIYFGLTVGF